MFEMREQYKQARFNNVSKNQSYDFTAYGGAPQITVERVVEYNN